MYPLRGSEETPPPGCRVLGWIGQVRLDQLGLLDPSVEGEFVERVGIRKHYRLGTELLCLWTRVLCGKYPRVL